MATLISCTSGSWTEASTWGLCDSTSEVDSELGSTTPGVAYGYSSSFTPGAITVDGIAFRVFFRTASPSGTVTVCIGQGGNPVAGTEVTINVSDINYVTADAAGMIRQSYGWYFFKFSSPVTLAGATDYTVGAKQTNAAEVSFYRDGTGSNYCRLLRTTTTQAPSTSDKIFVIGEHTGQGTGNNITVVMNNTDNTDYGTTSTTMPSLGIGKRGILSWKYNTSTNLRLSGLLWIWSGGEVDVGTTGSPISASSCKIEFDCGAAGDFGLIKGMGGKLVMQGNALSYDRAKLSADISASATSFTTDVSTGWKSGDMVVIPSTSRTYTELEAKTLNGDASGTTINVSGSFSYGHSGSSPRIAEVIHLTRNVKVTAVTAAYNAYILFYTDYDSNGTVDIDWVEFSELGNTSTGLKYGIYLTGVTASLNIQYCSFYYSYYGFYASATSNNWVFSHNVLYLSTSAFSGYASGAVYIAAISSTYTNWTLSYIDAYGSVGGTSSAGLCINALTGTITNLLVSSCTQFGIQFTNVAFPCGTLSDWTSHSNGNIGIVLYSNVWHTNTITNITTWCNNSTGFSFPNTGGTFGPLVINNLVSFGNNTANLEMNGVHNSRFVGGALHGLSASPTNYGIYIGVAPNTNVVFDGMNIGGSAVGKTDHFTNQLSNNGSAATTLYFYNTTIGSTSLYDYYSSAIYSAPNSVFIGFSKTNGVEGSELAYLYCGKIEIDSSNGEVGGNCLKITPSGNTYYMDTSTLVDISPMFQTPAKDGITRTILFKLKKTATLDSTSVQVALYQNGTNLSGWTTCSAISDSAYTQYSVSATPTENGVLDFAIKLDGDAGSLYLDSFKWV